MSYMDLQRTRASMLREWNLTTEKVAKAATSVLPEAEVYIVGSIVRIDRCFE